MNTPQHKQLSSNNGNNTMSIEYYIRHYFSLFWRWKWYIIISVPVIFAGWFIGVMKFGDSRPALESRVILQFVKNNGTVVSIDNASMQDQKSSCDAFIHSRAFIESISNKLSLRFFMNKFFRNEIFDSVSVEKDAPVGQYDFVVEKNSYSTYYSNNRLKIYKKLLITGSFIDLSQFSLPSMYIKFTDDFMAEPHSFSFNITTQRQAVDYIIGRLTTRFMGDNTILAITLRGKDYPFTTLVVNEIANEYVAHNAEVRRDAKNENVAILDKQLQEAKNNLAWSENAVRIFREAHPNVGVTNVTSSSMTEVATLENSINSIKNSIDEAGALQARCQVANIDDITDDKMTALYEAVTYLLSHQSGAAQALQSELNDVSIDKKRVDVEYAPQHPRVIENRKKIVRIAVNILKALSDVNGKMRTDAINSVNKRDALAAQNQKLPAQELQITDLMRKRDNAEELYTNLLSRYNINRVSVSTNSNDIIVLDYAVIPGTPGRIQILFRLILIGFAFALCIGFGPAILFDFFDKRARNEDDCRRLTRLLFLEGIPFNNETKSDKPLKDKLDSKLVAAGFDPGYFDDMYRSLRTKVLLNLHGEAHKMIVVTSLNAGDGKSLTASNLSIVMAQQKLNTILIDGDLRRGVQHHSFLLEKKPGLAEILSSPDEITSMPVNSFIKKTHIPNLSLLSCGMPIPNPAECMSSQKFRDLTSMLSEWFDVLILDTPPLMAAVDAAMLPDAFRHYIVVAKVARTNIPAIDKKIDEFLGLREKIMGIVLNGTPMTKKMYSYHYSYYKH
jgi:polysaccharide biosynthesis transport protein